MFRCLALSALSIVAGFAGLINVCVAQNAGETDAGRVPIGTKVSKLEFTDIRALRRELSEVGDFRAVVIIATSTDCPLVRRTMPRLCELYKDYSAKGVAVVAMNVSPSDTIRKMASQAIEFEAPFVFAKDQDQECVRALGLRRTPEVVILDADRTLRYRGRIDDQDRLGGSRAAPTRMDLRIALDEVLAGQPVTKPETPVDGCLISTPPKLQPDPKLTWTNGIASLIHQKCATCHHQSDAAPFPLTSWENVRDHAAMIQEVVRNETMPPWYASAEHGEFQNCTALTDHEKFRLLSWLQHDMPRGDVEQTIEPPGPPESKWRIGEPDVVITMLEEHEVPATGLVPYRYTVLPWLFLHDTWVEAFEILPDNRAVVHHCNMAYVTKDGAGEETFITGYVPGGQPMDLGRFESQVAFRIPAGSGLGLQIHYTTTGREERCRIQVGMRFPKETVKKQVHHFLLDPRRWTIPPQDPSFRIEAAHTLEHDVTLLGLFTHMHVRGRDMTYTAAHPDGKRETLLQIPNFNFEWQLGYEIAAGRKLLPAGTRIDAVAHYDNSAFNPYNPDPTAAVRYGPQTADEMFNGFVFFTHTNDSLNVSVDPETGAEKVAD